LSVRAISLALRSAEGCAIFAGRRNADKLAALVADIEASGGEIVARGLDARKEDDIAAFLRVADAHASPEAPRMPFGSVEFPVSAEPPVEISPSDRSPDLTASPGSPGRSLPVESGELGAGPADAQGEYSGHALSPK